MREAGRSKSGAAGSVGQCNAAAQRSATAQRGGNGITRRAGCALIPISPARSASLGVISRTPPRSIRCKLRALSGPSLRPSPSPPLAPSPPRPAALRPPQLPAYDTLWRNGGRGAGEDARDCRSVRSARAPAVCRRRRRPIGSLAHSLTRFASSDSKSWYSSSSSLSCCSTPRILFSRDGETSSLWWRVRVQAGKGRVQRGGTAAVSRPRASAGQATA